MDILSIIVILIIALGAGVFLTLPFLRTSTVVQKSAEEKKSLSSSAKWNMSKKVNQSMDKRAVHKPTIKKKISDDTIAVKKFKRNREDD